MEGRASYGDGFALKQKARCCCSQSIGNGPSRSRSCPSPERGPSAPDPQRLRRLLQSHPYPSFAREGRSSWSSRAGDWVTRSSPTPRRTPSRICPDGLNGRHSRRWIAAPTASPQNKPPRRAGGHGRGPLERLGRGSDVWASVYLRASPRHAGTAGFSIS